MELTTILPWAAAVVGVLVFFAFVVLAVLVGVLVFRRRQPTPTSLPTPPPMDQQKQSIDADVASVVQLYELFREAERLNAVREKMAAAASFKPGS